MLVQFLPLRNEHQLSLSLAVGRNINFCMAKRQYIVICILSLSNASNLFDANSVWGGEVCISSSISRGSLLQSVGAGKGGKAYSPMFEFSCVIVYLITIFFSTTHISTIL